MLLGDFNNLNDTQLRSYPLKQVVRLPTRRAAILDIINSETVCKLLSSININKAIGLDGIPSRILRDHGLTLAQLISTIFNASIREGYLPAIWRSAIVSSF